MNIDTIEKYDPEKAGTAEPASRREEKTIIDLKNSARFLAIPHHSLRILANSIPKNEEI